MASGGAVILQPLHLSLLDKVLSSAEDWLPPLHGAFQAAEASVKEIAPAPVLASSSSALPTLLCLARAGSKC